MVITVEKFFGPDEKIQPWAVKKFVAWKSKNMSYFFAFWALLGMSELSQSLNSV